MSRPFEPRDKVGYYGDVQALMRMAKAVRQDRSRGDEWKASVVTRLEEVVRLMLEAPEDEAKVSGG